MRLQQQEKIRLRLDFDSLLEARQKLIEIIQLIDQADLELNEYVRANKMETNCKIYGGNIIWNTSSYCSEEAINGILELQRKHFYIIKKQIDR